MIFNPIQWHLAMVHLPVVGLPICLLLFSIAVTKGDRRLDTITVLLTFGVVLASTVAYFTGPESLELLTEQTGIAGHYPEQHAIIGRAAFIALVVIGVMLLGRQVNRWQGEEDSIWMSRCIIILMLITCWLFAWSAHLGGKIRHTEIRSPEWILFPNLPE